MHMVAPERRHGSPGEPGHAFLEWRSSWRIIVYIYLITAVGNSISSQLGSFCQGNRYGTIRPAHHVQNHTCRDTLQQPARRAAVLGQASSPRPHWVAPNHTDSTESLVIHIQYYLNFTWLGQVIKYTVHQWRGVTATLTTCETLNPPNPLQSI